MVISDKTAVIPAFIGRKNVLIRTDIINADIPLLLSKTAMKNAKMSLNFQDDSLSAFGQKLPLRVTSNGLYYLPITKPSQLIDSISEQGADSYIVLKVTECKSNKEIAIKLHRCFGHPSAGRLLRLINSAGETWSRNESLKREINEVTNNCDVCKVFKKPPPRPRVGLPMASEFQEVVAMDLKMYQGRQILHLVDLCTRLSAAIFIADKKRDTIISALFRIWLSVYGAPQKFMSDNGGEFANADFLELCEQFGIVVKTTPAESPWSNGVVERNNQTLARSMDKIIEDTGCHADLALLWALNAKNSLQNVAGFSPFQLVLGMNPRLPSTLTDELPSLTQRTMPQLIRDNLNALHAARSAFISCENEEKIRRALSSNVRTSGEVKYATGDTVWYKRDSSVQWHGPATVIGQIDSQVFVKHGSFYIRVHPCRLQLKKEATRTVTKYPTAEPPSSELSHDGTHGSLGVPCYENGPSNVSIANVPVNNVPVDDGSVDITAVNDNPTPTVDSTNNVPDGITVDNHEVSVDTTTGAMNDRSTPINPATSQIKPGIKVRYRDYADQPTHEGIVTTRAGKARGVNRHWWNTTRPNGTSHAVDFNAVHEWEIIPQDNLDQEQGQETLVNATLLTINKSRELDAKKIELEQWKTMDVYQEVDDTGQDCMSLRCVMKEKINDNGKQTMKARLCVRGFEEEFTFRTD
jgi:transposase InsO family protein